MIETLLEVLGHMSTGSYWIAFGVGLFIATILGFIPGLGATVMMAIAFPIVVLSISEPAIGIVALAVITGTGNTFDSLPAQLMGVSTGSSQVAFLEGHQLTRKGLGAYSLGAVYAVSAIGGLVGAAALFLVMQILGPFILMMSFSEIAVISLFGLSMVSVLSKGAMLKGLSSAAFGVILGTVGFQTFSGTERFIFGLYDMRPGLPLVATIAGIMAIPEMLDLAATKKPIAPDDAVVSTKEVLRGFREGLRRWKMAIRHSILGVLLGALPGTGGSFVTWMSYGIGIATSKDKSQFGKGSLDGLLFAESAENSKEGGQAIPSLALGIPGSTSWALVVAALLAYGISPGPRLVSHHSDVIWLIVFSFALANLIITLLALFVTRQAMRVTQVPYAPIIGTVLPIVMLGSYFADRIMYVVPILVMMSVVGLLMKTYGWPRPPLILGFILAAPIEENLFTAVNLFGMWGIMTRPVTVIIAVIAFFIVYRLLRSMNRTDMLIEEIEDVADAMTDHGHEDGDSPGGSAPVGGPSGILSHGDAEASASGVSVAQDVVEPQEAPPMQRWGSRQWVALGFTLTGLYVFITAMNYDRLAARLLPALMGGGMTLASGAHLIRLVLKPPAGPVERVLDISMISTGADGARRSAMQLLGLVTVYILGIYAIGIHWAGFLPAVLAPFVLMKTGRRLLSAIISSICYYAFMSYIGNSLLHVRWRSGWLF